MFKISRVLMAATLAGAMVVPASASPRQAAPASQLPYQIAAARVTASGFSIVPPDGWSKGDANKSYFMIYLDAPKDNFRANFNANAVADDGATMTQISQAVKQMFPKQFDKWKLMGDGKTTVGGQEAYWISSGFSMSGYKIQNLQYYIRGKNKKFYILTFTALASNYKAYEMMFRQAAQTVQTGV